VVPEGQFASAIKLVCLMINYRRGRRVVRKFSKFKQLLSLPSKSGVLF
jgi:hypothetical protein